PSLGHILLRLGQSGERPASVAKAVTRFRKGRVQKRVQNLQDRLLHQAVYHRRNAQLSHSSAGLRDLRPSDRRRLIASVEQRIDESVQMLRTQGNSSPT